MPEEDKRGKNKSDNDLLLQLLFRENKFMHYRDMRRNHKANIYQDPGSSKLSPADDEKMTN